MSKYIYEINTFKGVIIILIRVIDIHKKYKKRKVLDGASFQADRGECIGIVGPNGCGKSTLLGILSGSLKADSGSIYFDESEISLNKGISGSFAGYVPQDNPLMERLSVLDNLRLWYCESHRDLKEDLKNGVPAMFGLADYASYPVEKLSAGMKKRLSIACALAKDPKILILDEPGASLDLICKEDIKKHLRRFIQNGGTVILTSHEESELDLCDRMYLLENGCLNELPERLNGRELMERMTKRHA